MSWRVYQGQVDPVQVAAAPETITADKWASQFGAPLKKAGLTAAIIAASGLAFVAGPVSGSGSGAVAAGFIATPVVQSFQYQTAAEPVPVFAAETITADKWQRPLAEPARSRLGLAAASQQSAAFVKAAPFAEAVSIDRWLRSFTEPQRLKRSLSQDTAFVSVVTSTVAVPSLWFATPRVQSFQYQVSTEPVAPPAVTPAPAFCWLMAWPQQPNGGLAVIDTSADFIAVENVTEDRWHQPLSEPIRSRRGLLAADQQATSFIKAAPFGETVSVDRWLRPYSEPTRRRTVDAGQSTFVYVVPAAGSGVGAVPTFWTEAPYDRWRIYQVSTTVLTPTAAETITLDKWFRSFGEPTRRSSGLPAPEQLALVKAPPFAETVSLDRWLVSLSQPTRRAGFPTPEQLALVKAPPFAETVSADRWWQPYSEPVRSRLGLAARHQQALAPFVKAVPFAETVSLDRWLRALSDPTRRIYPTSVYLPALNLDAFSRPPPLPVTIANWLAEWRPPTRLPVSLLYSFGFPDGSLMNPPAPVVGGPSEWIIRARRRGRR